MAKGNLKLTSVKVDADVFEEFKVECLRDKFTLQKLVNTSLLLYLMMRTSRRELKTTNKFYGSIQLC
jgi:hypothetical protein